MQNALTAPACRLVYSLKSKFLCIAAISQGYAWSTAQVYSEVFTYLWYNQQGELLRYVRLNQYAK